MQTLVYRIDLCTGPQASPRRHSSVDELYGLVNSSQSLTAVNGQRQRSLSDSGPRDESTQSNGKNTYVRILHACVLEHLNDINIHTKL